MTDLLVAEDAGGDDVLAEQVARLAVEVHNLADAFEKNSTATAEKVESNRRTADGASWIARVAFAGLGLAVAGIVILVGFVVQLKADEQRAEAIISCQNDVFRETIAQLNVRTDAANTDRGSLLAFLNTLATPGVTQAQSAAAFRAYLGQLDESNRTRAGAQLPTRTCG